MNDSLTRTFCESPYRRLIVATVTLLTGLAVVWPLVDDYFDKRASYVALREDLAEAEQTAAAIPRYQERTRELEVSLTALESRAVGEEQVGAYRNRIIEISRESGCQVRRIVISRPVIRPWRTVDDPTADAAATTDAEMTPFALHRRSLILTVDGSMSELHGLIERIEEEKFLSHPHRLEMHGADRTGKQVTLELEVWLFDLQPRAA